MIRKAILCLIVLPCLACGQSQEAQLQNIINERVSSDLYSIGTMAAKYEVIFAHHKSKIGFDDFYLQKAVYSIIYGFDVKDADISVAKNEGGALVLNVKLPVPREIKEARDRVTLEIDKRFSNYHPEDAFGNQINVSRELDNSVQAKLNRYQKHHIDQAKKMTKQYFQALADNYGLKLNYLME